MPLASAGLYQVNFTTKVAAEEQLNVFHYLASNFGNSLEQEIGDAFNAQLTPPIAVILSTGVAINDIVVFNLTTLDAEVVVAGVPASGTRSGLIMPAFNAAPIRLNRTTRETRNGRKRFGPMNEEDVNGNIFQATYTADLTLLESALELPLVLSGTTATLVIVRKQAIPLPWTSVLYNPVSSATMVNRVTTQVTRKQF